MMTSEILTMEPKVKMSIWNQRMLDLMKYAIDGTLAASQQEFLEALGFSYTNLRQVKNGSQSFRHEHFLAACEKYKVNMNWFYGLEKQMFRETKKQKAIDMLRAAVTAVELELRK